MKRSSAFAAYLMLCVAISGCSSGASKSFEVSAPEYASLVELTRAADLVVTGVVANTLGNEVDEGSDGSGGGVPVVFYSLKVRDVLKGTAGVTLVLNWLDTSEVSADYQSPLAVGSEVLLYLDRVSHDDAPGIDSYDTTYVALSGDVGTFDVTAGTARARSTVVESVDGKSVAVGTERFLSFPITAAAEVAGAKG